MVSLFSKSISLYNFTLVQLRVSLTVIPISLEIFCNDPMRVSVKELEIEFKSLVSEVIVSFSLSNVKLKLFNIPGGSSIRAMSGVYGGVNGGNGKEDIGGKGGNVG